MPIIVPRDIADLHALIANQGSRFEAGDYILNVPAAWLSTLDDETLIFLVRTDAEPQNELAKLPSPAVLELLATSRHPGIVRIVAENPAASETVLLTLAESPNGYVRQLVTEHPSASPRVLGMLSRDEDTTVRTNVAKHQNTSRDILDWLSRDAAWQVVAGVAERGGEPGEQALLELVTRAKGNHEIVPWLAEQPALPEAVMLKLARMVVAGVHYKVVPALMSNPSLTQGALNEIARSTHPAIVHYRSPFPQFRPPPASPKRDSDSLLQRIIRWFAR
jgi:hypothetical protein